MTLDLKNNLAVVLYGVDDIRFVSKNIMFRRHLVYRYTTMMPAAYIRIEDYT